MGKDSVKAYNSESHYRDYVYMENNNVPIGSIQRILGHENRSTNEIYLHSLGDSERVAIDVYESARKNSHTDSHT